MPLFFILGLSGHSLCLLAYYRKVKKESAYVNQIFVSVSETVQIFATSVFVTFVGILWNYDRGPQWFSRCYSCMWYTAYLASPMENITMTITLFLTLAMAMDRLFAIWKPHAYKNRDHKRDQIFSVCIAVSIGVLTSVYDCFQARMIELEPARFSLVPYITMPGATSVGIALISAFSALRTTIRLAATFCLILCNAFLVYLCSKRTKKVASMKNSSTVSATDHKRKEEEKTLLLLSVVQSTYISIGMLLHGTSIVLLATVPTYYYCEFRLVGPLSEMFLQGGDVIVFYLMLFLRSHYREMIRKEIPCLRRADNGIPSEMLAPSVPESRGRQIDDK